MNIYTLHVGQGQFVVITGKTEAIIVDTLLPATYQEGTTHVIGALANILHSKHLLGTIVTGFDDDHFCDVGVKTVLNKYRPDWVMYPRYYKATKTATACFKTIGELCEAKNLRKISVDLKDVTSSLVHDTLSNDFSFEVFSPHYDDMTTSNNSSIVCKVTERASGATYLITGDTEIPRWQKIVRLYKNELKADVMAAPHHGSKNGITEDVMTSVRPDTVIISAGIGNEYRHPNAEALAIYRKRAGVRIHSTNDEGGRSLLTVADGKSVKTTNYKA
jgi:beta-lactamase superfamily II metal-dependent hydrolase